MSTTDYRNQEALNKALNIYRTYMRSFIIFHLKKIPGTDVEDTVINSVSEWRADEIERSLADRDIKSIIDVDDFPRLVVGKKGENWKEVFRYPLNDDEGFQNQLWLIKTCRDESWAHPPEGDAESEGTRAYLFLIADVLRKIKKPDKQSEVEAIRDELFSDDTAERLEKAEEDNVEYKRSLAEAEKRLATVESEKNQYAEKNTALSKQVDQKENQRKKLDKQLKRAKAQNDKYRKDITGTKQRLEKSEAAQADYKKRFETTSKELKGTHAEWKETEERLATALNKLATAQARERGIAARLIAVQNLFTVAAIGEQEVQEVFQRVYPPIETDSTVRILDRRGVDKKNYLLELLEQEQPTIIYVQSEEMVDLLLERVVPKKTGFIEKHGEQTSEAEERGILEKLENGELIAIVSNAAFSTLASPHCIEHFVFCHLVPGLDEFFRQCEPAFASEKHAYLHLIYNREHDVEGLDKWLAQKYPDRETLINLHGALKGLVGVDGDFVNPENLCGQLNIVELEITELGIETGLAIFEEVGALERNTEGIKPLPFSGRRSEIYYRGEELKKETADFRAFQLEHSIEQIWEKTVVKLNVDSKQILRESNIQEKHFKVSERDNNAQPITETEQDNITLPIPDVWPLRTLNAFNSLRQRASKILDEDEAIILNSPDASYEVESTASYEVESTGLDDAKNEEDYQRKYDLAMQFAREHGVNALEQGIGQLIKDQTDPEYDFTEDETNMIRAFQNALTDFQTQYEQSAGAIESDNTTDGGAAEASHPPKPPRANAKVTVEQVKEIRARREAGESYSKLAKEFGLTPTGVRNIAMRNTWKDIE